MQLEDVLKLPEAWISSQNNHRLKSLPIAADETLDTSERWNCSDFISKMENVSLQSSQEARSSPPQNCSPRKSNIY